MLSRRATPQAPLLTNPQVKLLGNFNVTLLLQGELFPEVDSFRKLNGSNEDPHLRQNSSTSVCPP